MVKKKSKPQKKHKKQPVDSAKLTALTEEGLTVLGKYSDPDNVAIDQRYRPLIEAIGGTAVSPTGYATEWGTSFLAKQCVLAGYNLGHKRNPPQVEPSVLTYHLIARIKHLNDTDNAELTPLAASLWATILSKKLNIYSKNVSAWTHIYAAYRIGTERRIAEYERKTAKSRGK